MFINAKHLLNVVKHGGYTDEELNVLSDDIVEVVLRNGNGDEVVYECSDNLIVKMSEESYDGLHYKKIVSNVVQHFVELPQDRLFEAQMVEMRGVLYRIFKVVDTVYIHNEITNELHSNCHIDELEGLLLDVDSEYKLYKKHYQSA